MAGETKRRRLVIRDAEGFKTALAGALGKRPEDLREDHLTILEEDGYCKDAYLVDDAMRPIREAARRYKVLESIYRKKPAAHKPAAPKTETVLPDERLHALYEIIGIIESQNPRICSFRSEVLQGRLLEGEAVPDWIKAQVKGPATIWARFPLDRPPEGLSLEELGAAIFKAAQQYQESGWPAAQLQTEILALAGEGEYTEKVYVTRNGVLDRLKKLATELAKRYKWHEAIAVEFILTGNLTISKGKAGFELRAPFPALSKIILEVDPRMNAQEVADLYSKVRAEMKKGRDKPMGDRNLSLAVWAVKNYEPNLTWPEMQRMWRQEHHDNPQWVKPYEDKDARNFSRDVKRSYELVTGATWPPVTR